jgi:hypothetical protein
MPATRLSLLPKSTTDAVWKITCGGTSIARAMSALQRTQLASEGGLGGAR